MIDTDEIVGFAEVELQEFDLTTLKRCSFRTSNSRIAEVIELWRSGLTYGQIEVITGVNSQTMKIWITKHFFGYKGSNGHLIKLTSKINDKH